MTATAGTNPSMELSATDMPVSHAVPMSPESHAAQAGAPLPSLPGALPTHRTHIAVLDGLRGLAILLVMFAHLAVGERGQTFITKSFLKLSAVGWVGVDLFFVLSGFLITGILLDSKNKPGYFRNFYARRTLRIFPLYYGVLAVTFGLVPLVMAWRGLAASSMPASAQASLWTYTCNIWISIKNSWLPSTDFFRFDHFWSLAVEEQFYLIWPAVVLLCNRRTLARVCIASAIGAVLFRLIILQINPTGWTAYVSMPARLDTLALGGLLAIAARQPLGLTPYVKIARCIFWPALIGLAILFVICNGLLNETLRVRQVGFPLVTLAAVSGLLCVVAAPRDGAIAKVFSSRVLRFLGKYSYGLYIFDYLMFPYFSTQLGTMRFAMNHSYTVALLMHAACAWTAAIAMAWLSFNLYERYFLKLKKWF